MAAILLIEDNADLRVVMQQALAIAGHHVSVAEDGRAGLRLAQCIPVDLVITDIVMPEQDGLETIMHLRKILPALPVIVMSGDAPRHATLYLSLAKKLGAVQTLLKPFSNASLLDAVNAALASAGGPPKPE